MNKLMIKKSKRIKRMKFKLTPEIEVFFVTLENNNDLSFKNNHAL